jgi:hypothetical protein
MMCRALTLHFKEHKTDVKSWLTDYTLLLLWCFLSCQVSQLSGDLLVLAAGQARQMGRMLNVCPDALLDDGLLDFTLLFGSPGKQVRSA